MQTAVCAARPSGFSVVCRLSGDLVGDRSAASEAYRHPVAESASVSATESNSGQCSLKHRAEPRRARNLNRCWWFGRIEAFALNGQACFLPPAQRVSEIPFRLISGSLNQHRSPDAVCHQEICRWKICGEANRTVVELFGQHLAAISMSVGVEEESRGCAGREVQRAQRF